MKGRHGDRRSTRPLGHVDPDVLAEFRAGLITDRGVIAGRRGRAIVIHLAGCADCAALDNRLAQVSALLAAAPVPTVPDALGRRLDSALAAFATESQNQISTERTSAQSPTARRVPSVADVLRGGSRGDPSRRSGKRDGSRSRRVVRARVLAPAAAALAALGGIGYGLSQLSGPSSTIASSNSAAGSAARGGAAASAGSSALHERHQGLNGMNRRGASPVLVVSSDLNYQPATWAQQVTAQLKVLGTLPKKPASATVADCVLNVTWGSAVVLVESARYRGAPATVIVAPGTRGDLAWVTGAACSETNSDVLAHAVLSSGTSAP